MEDFGALVILALDIGVGYWAKNRGRNPILWFVISVIMTPILAVPILLLMKDYNPNGITNQYLRNAFAKKLGDNESLPVVTAPTLLMKKGEVCHYSAPVEYAVTKNVIVNYQGSHTGGSIRLMKGLSVHSGERNLTPIRQNISDLTPAVLSVTSQRVVLACSKASFDKPIDKITSVIPRADGLEIQIGDNTYQMLTKDGIYIYQIISRVYSRI